MTDTETSKRVWVDDEDGVQARETPAFLKQSHTAPSWATTDREREENELAGGSAGETATGDDVTTSSSVADTNMRKRFRSEGLDALLSRTEPLLSSKHDRRHASAPVTLSVLPLPRDCAHSVHWHRNGQLAIVGGNHHIYAFHAAGKFVEQLSKVDVVKRVEHTALTASGEEVIVVSHEAYVPLLLSLTTEKVVPLNFLDTRDTAIYRNARRDNTKKELFISAIATKPDDALRKTVAVASGCTVKLGALSTGSVLTQITVDDPVTDVCFSSSTEITIATGNRLRVFDIRKSARFLREVVDQGALQITSFAIGSAAAASAASSHALAIGSSSGVVNVYGGGVGSDGSGPNVAPLKTLKNLTTAVNAMCFGEDSHGDVVLAFSTKGQKAGFRLASLPECRVVPSFPAVSTRHSFVQCLAIAPTVPVLSVGENQRVVNYAL